MAERRNIELVDGRLLTVVFTDANDGNFSVRQESSSLTAQHRTITPLPWSWLRQTHSAVGFVVAAAGQHAGIEGDALVTAASNCPVSVTTADCAPVVLVAEGGVAVVHAGWRGLLDGVIENAGLLLQDVAGPPVQSLLGPCISAASYEFAPADLEFVAARYGPDVVATTAWGTPALDMAQGVGRACIEAGWPAPAPLACTSGEAWFSHRVRTDPERLATVAWIEESSDAG